MTGSQLTWAEINLDSIAHNIKAFREHVGIKVEVMAVVKANAYGHGSVQVARTALEAGATRLAVHRAIEGIELRQAGIRAPVLVMGYTPVTGTEAILKWQLTPSLMDMDFARALSSRAKSAGVVIPVHVKVDTGMGRYGLLPEEVTQFLLEMRQLPGILLEGLFTHFATADSVDAHWVRQQLAVFLDVRAAISEAGIQVPIAHAANSAAMMKYPETHLNAVRPGIALYGMHPSDEWQPAIDIRPALSLKSRVVRVRTLPEGTGISYGRTFITSKPTRAALIPVGYGDGYHRILSNKGSVLIRGRRAPILGRVCMDQFVVDCSGIPDIEVDDEVVLVGSQGTERISAEELARLAGTINYEVTTSLLPRVERFYLREGKVVEMLTLEKT